MRPFAFVLALLWSCGSSSSSGSEPPVTSTATELAAPPAPASPPPTTAAQPPAEIDPEAAPEPAAPSIPQADVQAFLETWRAAQNARDFDAYQRLYAARFEGIRRSGPRTRRFGRESWLADRRTMFAQPEQTVDISDVAIASAGGALTVRFTQAYATARYRDRGPKQLVLVREQGELRIAREEMLASELLSFSSPPPGSESDLLLTVTVGSTSYVVLDAAPSGDWGSGPISLLSRGTGGEIVTRRAANPPAQHAALRDVVLFAADGGRCNARLGARFLLSRVDVHFGTEQAWQGDTDLDGTPDAPPATRAQIAAQAFGDGLLLVAQIETDGCPGLWARAAGRPELAVYARGAPSAELSARAITAFRARPAWEALQGEYTADPGATSGGRWDEWQGSSPHVETWTHAESQRTFVSVHARVSIGACAEFSGSDTAIFELRDNELAVLGSAEQAPYVEPLAVVDADGDGVPEVIGSDELWSLAGGAWTLRQTVRGANYDCGC